MKLIDVSHWQGNIDFAKVKASGIEEVIIKEYRATVSNEIYLNGQKYYNLSLFLK